MMNVKVYAPGFLSLGQTNSQGYLSIPQGATLSDLYHFLSFPEAFRLSFYCCVNDEKAGWDLSLKEGDQVSFIFPISGG